MELLLLLLSNSLRVEIRHLPSTSTSTLRHQNFKKKQVQITIEMMIKKKFLEESLLAFFLSFEMLWTRERKKKKMMMMKKKKKRRRGPILRAGGRTERKNGKRKSQWEIYPT